MIFNEDIIKWSKEYKGEKYHALLSDPPYHLTTIVKRFGKNGSAPAQYGTDGVFSRASRGFMGQQWDGGDIAFDPETWATIMPVLHDGAFGMAFSASRNWHRLAVAIEDAGFIIHPTIFGWLNGQGFPKATRIHKEGKGDFDSHRYGLQALKPAIEPIFVFQKPYNGKARDNIVETGAGTLNIDGGRIPLNGDSYVINRFDDGAKPWGNGAGHKYTSKRVEKLQGSKKGFRAGKGFGSTLGYGEVTASEDEYNPVGRWPANFILNETTAPLLDAQTGITKSSDAIRKNNRPISNVFGKYNPDETLGYLDVGGASRFFFRVEEQIDEADPIYYCSKVSPKERNAGLEERNPHPTMKRIELSKYLATLLLPPQEYSPRRLLVPFSGVASEMIGGILAGWEVVDGVEFDKENGYVDIAEKRIEYWRNK